jgi:uncharacterized protein (TIGR03083 family)
MTRSSVQDADLTETIAADHRELAAVLSNLPAESWDAPSLCAGWRVREVAAHITMPFRYSNARFAIEMIRARGQFHQMADRCARRDAAAAPGELAAALRDNATYPWKPPGGGLEAALTHDVIHGLDVTAPLGIGRRIPEERLRIVLGTSTRPNARKHFGASLTGIELVADDIEWLFGSGTPLSGAARDLARVLCGARPPAGRLRHSPRRPAGPRGG